MRGFEKRYVVTVRIGQLGYYQGALWSFWTLQQQSVPGVQIVGKRTGGGMKDNLIKLLIIPSLWRIQSLSRLTEQSKMKAIEQCMSPKILVGLSHGLYLEPLFDPSKPTRPVFLLVVVVFLFVCLLFLLLLFFSNNTRQYFHISLQHFLDLIGVGT